MDKIVVGVDGSEPSLRAVDFAAKLATETKAELIIFTAAEELYVSGEALKDFARSENLATEWGDLSEARATQILSTAHARAATPAGIRVRTEWRLGDPTAEIIRFAQDECSDLLVVGHVGRSRLAGLVLGSVAFKLVALAPCPVTVVGPVPER